MEEQQTLTTGIIDHPCVFRGGQDGVGEIDNLLLVEVAGEGIVVRPRIGGEQHPVAYIFQRLAAAAGIGKGLAFAGLAGGKGAVRQPALESVQIIAVPVDHQHQRAQYQRGGDCKGHNAKQDIRFFCPLGGDFGGFLIHNTSSSYQSFVMYSPPGGTVGPARVRLPEARMSGMSSGDSLPSAA